MSRDGSLPPGCKDLRDTLQQVRLVGKNGTQLGIMMLCEAMKIADDERAELVKITETATLPVYRLIDQEEYRKIIQKRKNK